MFEVRFFEVRLIVLQVGFTLRALRNAYET